MRVELPARPESVTRARHAAAGFAARAGADIADVSLAVSEAVGNAVIHAFEEGEQGMIVVSGEIEAGGVLVVSVVDDGRGMRPDPASRGLGLGLSLIGSVASALRIERATPQGTRVTMRFG
jgi:anti-sigma regulatory factor (Ser/Thr protein kinase)